jgi:hypothetical protein
MMGVDDSLYTYLSAYAGLVSLVSKRIYPIVMPLNAVLPAVSYQRISTERTHAFQTDPTLTSATYQISSWAKTDTVRKGYSHTQLVSTQVRLALQNYSGALGSGGVTVSAVLLIGELSDYDTSTETYAIHQDFEVWYQEV